MIREACGREKTIDFNANSLSPNRMKGVFFRGKHAAVAVAGRLHWGERGRLVNKN